VTEADDYARGHAAGGIAERLDSHDRHFAAINGSLAQIAGRLGEMTLALQRLSDQAVARDATVVTTAAALKDADAARRREDDKSWSPIGRLFAAIGAATAVITVVLAVFLALSD
jgi:hypothetical protein